MAYFLRALPLIRSRPWLIILGISCELWYLFYFVGQFSLPKYYQALHDINYMVHRSTMGFVIYVLAFSTLFVLMGFAWWEARRFRDRLTLYLILGFGAIFAYTMVFVYPITAIDIYVYIAQSLTMVKYGASPITVVPATYADPLIKLAGGWTYYPAPYGPLGLIIDAWPTRVVGEHLLTDLLLIKCTFATMIVIEAFLVYKILARLAPKIAIAGALFVAWNPYLLFEFSANGHNDIAMMLFVLLAIWALVENYQVPAFVLIVASALVKYATLPLIPLFLIYSLFNQPTMANRIKYLTFAISSATLLILIFFYPFWQGLKTLAPLIYQDSRLMASFPALLADVQFIDAFPALQTALHFIASLPGLSSLQADSGKECGLLLFGFSYLYALFLIITSTHGRAVIDSNCGPYQDLRSGHLVRQAAPSTHGRDKSGPYPLALKRTLSSGQLPENIFTHGRDESGPYPLALKRTLSSGQLPENIFSLLWACFITLFSLLAFAATNVEIWYIIWPSLIAILLADSFITLLMIVLMYGTSLTATLFYFIYPWLGLTAPGLAVTSDMAYLMTFLPTMLLLIGYSLMKRLSTPRQPITHVPSGRAPGKWKVWVKTSRPLTLTATVSPLLVGTAVAYYEGTFHLLIFLVTLLSCLFLQIGTNYFNEYFDYRYGLDHAGSLGASTVIFRQEMTAKQVFWGGILCFGIATLLGIILILLVGPVIILFGLIGILIAYFYSAKPFRFASRGFGDILVYLAMGFLMTWGSYYVQIPHWSWSAFAASVPIGLLVTAILNMNNVRDYEDDLAVNKKTLPVRFGRKFGQIYHATLLISSYLSTTIFALTNLLPWTALTIWLTFPLAQRLIRSVLSANDRKAFIIGIKRTAQLHLIFGTILALTIIIAH